jgi:hypothetical protein
MCFTPLQIMVAIALSTAHRLALKVVEQVAPALVVLAERYLTVLGLLAVEAATVVVADVVKRKALAAALVDILLLVVEAGTLDHVV